MNRLRTLIVDDEDLARQRIADLLRGDEELEIIGECAFGEDAVQVLRRDAPDLVFLDVRLPDLDGFGVLDRAGKECQPMVVFVTAFDEHAVQAFDVRAIDYLVKPFERDRLYQAVGRAKREFRRQSDVVSRLQGLGRVVGGRIAVRVDGRVVRVRLDDIEHLEAERDSSRLHLRGGEPIVTRESLSSLEARLPTAAFLRVHRSHIVNLMRVREIQPWFQGEYVLELEGGDKVVTGRTYREKVQVLLR